MEVDPTGHDLPRSPSSIPSFYKNGKRPRHFNDEFFDEGELEYKQAWQRLNHQHVYIPSVEGHGLSNDNQQTAPSKASQPIVCRLAPCHGDHTFSSMSAYEQHYDATHRYLCYTCGKPMPGERWLQLHIHEIHDILVKIRRERGERTYQCFVANCPQAFKSTHGRRLHLIDRHKYPHSFNFDIVKEGALSFEKRVKKLGAKRAHKAATSMRRDSVTSDSSMDVESSSSSRETSPSPQSDAIGAIHPHRTANQRSNSIHQQLQPSQSANDGHEGHADPISRTSHDMDMEIDQLQTNLSKLTLPKTTTKKHGHIDRPKLQPGFYRGPPMSKQNQWHNAGQANPAADATVMPVPVATSRVNTWMVPRQVNTAKPSKPSKPLRGPTFSDVHME